MNKLNTPCRTSAMLASMAIVFMAALGISCSRQQTKDYTQYVDVFIGTGGHGHTYPGASVPFGGIQPSPDTRIYGWDACSGYYYADSTINGFSHTHLNGTGCCDLGDLLLMPTTGEQDITPEPEKAQTKSYASPFSHSNEVAEPGYYSVKLDRYGITCEMTADEHTAIHRWTFPKTDKGGVIIDLDYSLEDQVNQEMELKAIDKYTLQARKKTVYWAFDQYANFFMHCSNPFTCTIINDTVTINGKQKPRMKALLDFGPMEEGEVVRMEVGFSTIDIDGAKNNWLKASGRIFSDIRAEAKSKWNKYLSKIDIDTDDADQRTIFYTALYHTGLQPNILTEVDGRHWGMDGKPHAMEDDKKMYTTFSTWDTHRAFHPLMSIIDPELNEAFVNSLLVKATENGILPMWELQGNETGCMIGYHAASIITDAYMKGCRSFDANEALKAMRRTAEYDTTGIICPRLVLPCLMPQAKYWKNKLGYVPYDKDNEAVAKALEYAYNDWCISVMAEAVGDTAVAKKYAELGKAYRNYYDPSTGFMRGKDEKGNWRTPFDPSRSTHRNDDYCEGNAWQWTWYVPHDPEGLMQLMGGRDAFIKRLDGLFSASSDLTGENVSADISGLIGQYAHGNEPSHHIIHFYNYAGVPYKTQELVDQVLTTLYHNDPDGLSGNEDCGQMSAWYILNSMGFYQLTPGKPVYSIGRPLFKCVTINLTNGKKFTIKAENNSKANKYVQSMKLNGKELKQPFFNHSDIMAGGELTLVMGPNPKK